MNNEVIFQNNDQSLDNPLNQPVIQKKKLALPSDKRLLALIALGVIIVILLIVATIVTATRQKPNNRVTPTPTFIPTQAITPTPIAVPTEFQSLINQINQKINPSPEIYPPQIDDTVGL